MKRVVVLVNKDFEYKGFIEGLRDTIQVYGGTNGRDAECRFDNLIADIYCVNHFFKDTENSSNSEVKYNYLKELFKRNSFRLDEIDGVLSFSTSESTPCNQGRDGTESRNGCVYVGNKFYLNDRRENDEKTESHLVIGYDDINVEYYEEKPILPYLYDYLNNCTMNLKPAYNVSAEKLRCIAGSNFIGVGVVNVMNYECYRKADEVAYDQFTSSEYMNNNEPVGIETTHGVIVKALRETLAELKIEKEIPVNFISPIVDRYLRFDDDVDGKEGKQNFVCSYNGGVATAHMLTILNAYWKGY